MGRYKREKESCCCWKSFFCRNRDGNYSAQKTNTRALPSTVSHIESCEGGRVETQFSDCYTFWRKRFSGNIHEITRRQYVDLYDLFQLLHCSNTRPAEPNVELLCHSWRISQSLSEYEYWPNISSPRLFHPFRGKDGRKEHSSNS